MKKRLAILLAMLMVMSALFVGITTAVSAADSIAGVSWTGDGYQEMLSAYKLNTTSVKVKLSSGSIANYPTSTSYLYLDEDHTNLLKTEPELGETYYFDFWIYDVDLTHNITNANSTIQYTGFSKGKVLSAMTEYNDIKVSCSIMYGYLTGGVNAVATGVEYDSTLGAYAPKFSKLKCVSTEDKELDPIKVPNSSGTGYYSYYGAQSGALYKTFNNGSFDNKNKLTTAPVLGETYYSYILLNSIDGNLHIEEDLVDIRIPGYEVEYIKSYESDMGFTSQVCYSITYVGYDIYVGGVGMEEGRYLASGATVTTTTKPSGSYAYYSDGVLTLNNYTYDGAGWIVPKYPSYTALVYSEKALTVRLVGTNTLINSIDSGGVGIWAHNEALTIIDGGSGALNMTVKDDGIYTYNGDIAIQGGAITVTAGDYGIYSKSKLTISGGNITIASNDDGLFAYGGDMTISGGTINVDSGADGILAGDDATISGGTVTVTADDYGICTYANLTISDGTITITTDDYGIYTYDNLTISGGTITIDAGATGIYASNGDVSISGGTLNVTSDNYGIYADDSLTISGGDVTVKARYYAVCACDYDLTITGGNLDLTTTDTEKEDNDYHSLCSFFGDVVIGDGVKLLASTEPDGALVSYVAANNDTYDRVVTAFPDVYVGPVGLFDGEYLANGSTTPTTTQPSGGYAYYKDGTLTLNDYTYDGAGYVVPAYSSYTALVYSEKALTVKLVGTNTLTNSIDSKGVGIWVENEALTIIDGGSGALNITVKDDGIFADDDDVNIQGGAITITADNYGICAYYNVDISGGTINVDSGADGIYADYGDVTISGGTLNVTTDDYGIYAYINLTISGGTINVDSGDDGIYASNGELTISGGTVTVTADYYGIYAYEKMTIQGGTITIDSNDYGIYTDDDATISDGIITIAADSYGIYAEDSLTISGGDVTVKARYYAVYTCDYDLTITGGNLDLTTTDTEYEDNDYYSLRSYFGNLVIGDGVKLLASTEPDGALVSYVAANNNTYDRVVIAFPGVYVGPVGLFDGEYLANGSTTPTTTKPTGGYAYYKDGTLTLNNYTYSGAGYVVPAYSSYTALVYSEKALAVKLVGTNTLANSIDSKGVGIWVENEALTIIDGGSGALNVTVKDDGINADDNDINIQGGIITITVDDYGIYSDGNTTISDGIITINADYGICAYGDDTTISGGTVTVTAEYDGIYSVGNLTISDGIITIDSNDDGIYAYGGDTTISGGTITVTAGNDGIYSDGNITISGGTITIDSNDDGIYADDDATISGGTITINAYRGIYADYGDVSISGGTLNVTAVRYGIYAEENLTISGGDVTIKARYYAVYACDYDLTITGGNLDLTTTDTENEDNDYYSLRSYYGNIVIGDGVKLLASTEPDGTLSEYVLANNATYDRVATAKPLTIKTQPKSSQTANGETAKVTVKATGNGLKYQWYIKNAGSSKYSKSSITTDTYTVKMSSSVRDRYVYCVVTDQYGNSVKSNTVVLRMAASITTDLATAYAKMGATAEVTMKASGDGLKYTWYIKNAGASKFSKSSVTSSTYSVTMSSTTKNRQVYCVVTDKYGKTAQSKTVYLREVVTITAQSKTNYTKMGDKATASVTASGDGLTYTWYVKNEGQTEYSQSSITTATYSVTMSDKVKNRLLYCVVKDKYGNEVKSETVRLREAASITAQTKTNYTKMGDTATASVTASGDGLTYTWYVKNEGQTEYSKSSITTATYTAKMTDKVKNCLLYCVVKDKYGKEAKSKTVSLCEAASITAQSKTNYTKMGDKATASVTASGDDLTYTWYVKNEGQTEYSKSSITTATYTTKMTDKVKNRLLYCVVKDKYGNEVKSETVRFREAASITAQPKTGYAKMGDTATASVTASGDGLTYTWYVKNEGQTKYSKSSITTATYSVTMSDKVKNRLVYCVVKDKYGKEAKSETVSLREAVSITAQSKTTYTKKGDKATAIVTASGDDLTYTWYVKNEGQTEYSQSSITTATYSVTMSDKVKNRLLYCVVKDKYGNEVKSETVRLKMK